MTAPNDAIVAKRDSHGSVDTTEITALAESAGYEVVDDVTQIRPEDPGTYLGAGAVERLATVVAETDAGVVIVDDRLTPSQHHNLRDALPAGTAVRDRYRLVLAIFAEGATSRRAQLQVELARLRYELPRIEADEDAGMLNPRTEKGSPVYDVRDRIDELTRQLRELPSPAEQFRERRREEGFDLVTIAGYTNAGKSTLLHRLADDLDLEEMDPDHPDQPPEVGVADRLFETLETTTRRTTVADRPVLLTDTVGFVDDLPHELVESFGETLSEAGAADAVVLVADASDPPETLVDKLEVALDVLDAQGVDRADVVTALNKVDLLEPAELHARRQAVDEIAPEPIPTSILEGAGIDAVVDALVDRLPTARARIVAPNCDEAMGLVSTAYDRTAVEDVQYRDDTVVLTAEGRPEVIEQLQGAAEAVAAEGATGDS